jgi:hypothetical protein
MFQDEGGKVQWNDPRLSPESLRSRGVDVQDIFIV